MLVQGAQVMLKTSPKKIVLLQLVSGKKTCRNRLIRYLGGILYGGYYIWGIFSNTKEESEVSFSRSLQDVPKRDRGMEEKIR